MNNRSRSGIPTAKSIKRWYEQFNVSGCLSVGHKRRGISYAKPVRCGENIEAVLMSVEATPKKSVRRRSAELGLSHTSVYRILRHDLKMKPYHISVHQGLTAENDYFEGRVISRFTEKTWASHSPDLNPLDFFLWGHLKDQKSGEQFQTLNDLKSLVECLIRAVTPEQCEDTIQHFLLRMWRCVQRDGGHIEQLL